MPRSLAGGENTAELFERFVRERVPSLERFLGRLRVREDDVEDVAQESVARLLRYRDQEPPEAWTALLYRIAINVTRDRARRDRHAAPTADTAAEPVAADASPEQHASDLESLARVRAAILRLPPRCRAVYLMHRVEGLSYPEIARRCGVSTKAVEKHMSHALRELRERAGAETP
ncbi:MAG TPA: RNA polymerase sigma factor [Rhodanobacteraceae bacterium]|nr:RNA polymerase sigma factor [Rhodanobacteraceae bacterium]